jgi:hypothetical protein
MRLVVATDKLLKPTKHYHFIVLLFFMLWLMSCTLGMHNLSREVIATSITAEKTETGYNVNADYTLFLNRAITPADQGLWTSLLVYSNTQTIEEARNMTQYVARSSFPMRIMLQGTKSAGKTIPVKLSVREDQIGELPEGSYSVYAVGYFPDWFRNKLGTFSVTIDPATLKRHVTASNYVSDHNMDFRDNLSKDEPSMLAVDQNKILTRMISVERVNATKNNRWNWFQFRIPKKDPGGTVLDMSYLLDKPAGNHGFLKIDDGYFTFEDGTRGRFWGTVLGAPVIFQNYKASEKLAKRLAHMGCNLVRIHNIAAQWAMPNILHFSYPEKNKSPSPEHLSAKSLDRLDYLIFQLKKRGIYVYLDLYADPRSFKNAPFFNKEIVASNKKLNAELLTHYNPYTKIKYINEPAILAMQIVNEDSLFFQEYYKHTPEEYHEELRSIWNGWLANKYGSQQKLAEAWVDSDGGCILKPEEYLEKRSVEWPEQFRTKASSTMKVPITGSNHWVGCAGDILSNIDMEMGFLDQHWYWDHPRTDFAGGKRGVGAKISGKAMVKSMGNGDTITWLSRRRMHKKPYMVSEWNNCRPNEYRVEGPVMIASYAMLQDWDALTQMSFKNVDWRHKMSDENFDFSDDPSIVGLWPAIALMFHRKDIQAAKKEYVYDVPVESLLSNRWIGRSIPPDMCLIGRVSNRIVSSEIGNAKPPGIYRDSTASVKTSDTGELSWDTRKGVFSVNTMRTQAVVGFFDGKEIALRDVVFKPTTKFCALILSALENNSISKSKHLLLTAVARCENAGTLKNPAKTILLDGGEAPIFIEPVEAETRIRFDKKYKDLHVYALDFSGHRKNEVVRDSDSNTLNFKLCGMYETIYYEICCTEY